MTPAAKKLLIVLTNFRIEHNRMPTFKEACYYYGTSSKGHIDRLLLQLSELGHIERVQRTMPFELKLK